MDIQHRLTGFTASAATGIMWMVPWILAGYAVGGVPVAIARAVDLIRVKVNLAAQ
jgi:hypothetical protein